MAYNDKLDADRQISMEEKIASHIIGMGEWSLIHEEEAADLSREILQMVLEEFRPDLCE